MANFCEAIQNYFGTTKLKPISVPAWIELPKRIDPDDASHLAIMLTVKMLESYELAAVSASRERQMYATGNDGDLSSD